MKKYSVKFLTAIILIVFIIVSCKKGDKLPCCIPGPDKSETFIIKYNNLEYLNIVGDIDVIDTSVAIGIDMKGNIDYTSWANDDNVRNLFHYYSHLYGDTSYNSHPWEIAILDTIIKFEIYADKPLADSSSSLLVNDFFKINYRSYYDFIKSRYSKSYSLQSSDNYEIQNIYNGVLIDPLISFRLKKPIKQTCERTLTIKVHTISGKVFEKTKKYTIKGEI
ncbi:MAG: hypothetical protein SNJ71_08150 [Bacteroidales bacterium]